MKYGMAVFLLNPLVEQVEGEGMVSNGRGNKMTCFHKLASSSYGFGLIKLLELGLNGNRVLGLRDNLIA